MGHTDTFSDLPRHATDYTPDQVERVIAYLAKKPLAELRHRQCAMRSQIEFAHGQAQAACGAEKDRWAITLADLNAMFDLETEAVARREFGSQIR